MIFSTTINNNKIDIEILSYNKKLNVTYNNSKKSINCIPISSNNYSLILNGKTYYLHIDLKKNYYYVTINYNTYRIELKDKLDLILDKYKKNNPNTSVNEILSPIPGLINKIFVQKGDKIQNGDKLCILEAMKMENEIKSNQDGIIKNIYIKEGMNINKDQIMMEIKING